MKKDAEGKMNMDGGDTFCEKCRNYPAGTGV
jgi:hypothetical protein